MFGFPSLLPGKTNRFKIGRKHDFPSGTMKYFKDDQVYVFSDAEGIYAISAVCTHLGCTPIWDENEAQFKCPCHGSRFNIDGINLEGPAPRPLERVAVRITEEGQLDIDPDKTFRHERGQWQDPSSRVLM